MSYLVIDPEDWFSHNEAHFVFHHTVAQPYNAIPTTLHFVQLNNFPVNNTTYDTLFCCIRLLIKDQFFTEKEEETEKDAELIDPLPNKLKACVVS